VTCEEIESTSKRQLKKQLGEREEGKNISRSKEFNKPLRCRHWQMHRYVKILLTVECLQSVQYDFYIFAKLSHYKENNKKNIIKNHFTKPANIIKSRPTKRHW